MAPEHNYDDLIFLCVARSSGAPLPALLSASAYINRTLPTYEELTESLGRLVQAGLVEAQESSFVLTIAGNELFESVGGIAAAPIAQLCDAGAAIKLAALPVGEVEPFPLSRELFVSSLRGYRFRS